MNRTTAREAALQCIFGLDFGGGAPDALDDRLSDEGLALLGEQSGLFSGAPDDQGAEYIRAVVRGVNTNLADLDGYISKYATGWSVGRISRVCKAALRLSIYEILHIPEIPAGVSINEAVELTKKYENEDMPAFVNGVLGGFVRGEGIGK